MRTTIEVKKEYLVLPISEEASNKTLSIEADGKVEDAQYVRLDPLSPHYNVYYPIGRYKGRKITINVTPDMRLSDIQTDEPDYGKAEAYPFRPQWHYAPRYGWNNDPNGLCAYTSPVTGKTEYHMFYQYNPYCSVWGNMHWGHAVSEDLLEWKELPIALYPDENGTMFSGCAVVDEENRSGLKRGNEHPILLYYTCAGGTSALSVGKRYAQCLAFSTDGGRTFEKYPGNPLIDCVVPGNRDPKAVWCEELGRFILALYAAESEYLLYTSEDLLHWEKFGNISLDGDSEVPDLFPLCADGKRYWILLGGSGRYNVMEFESGAFRTIRSSRPLFYGGHRYAPQTFWGMPGGRTVGIVWEKGLLFPSPRPIASQMSFPYELTLHGRDGDIYLAARPISEIERLYAESVSHENISVTPDKDFRLPLKKDAYDISLDIAAISAGKLNVAIFGRTIRIDGEKNNVVGDAGEEMPLSVTGDDKKIRIIADRCGFEVFTGEGTAVMTVPAVCDYNLPELRIFGAARLNSVTVHRLIERKK